MNASDSLDATRGVSIGRRRPSTLGFRCLCFLLAAVALSRAVELAGQVPGAAATTGDSIPPPRPPAFSPRGAFVRSLLVPGWGQAHVGASTRGAVYFALSASSLWMTYVSSRQLADARRQVE